MCCGGGVPSKVICTLDEYHKRCKENFLEYAKTYARRRKEIFGIYPEENEMNWYSVLFTEKNSDTRKNILNKLRVDGDNKSDIIDDLMGFEPIYDSYEEFIKDIN